MKEYIFHTGKDLLKLTHRHKLKISDIVLLHEVVLSEKPEEQVRERMARRYKVMKNAIKKGIRSSKKSRSGMSGGSAKKIAENFGNKKLLLNKFALKTVAYAIATGETNACMGQIVAFPTAGASGVLPSVLIAMQEERKFKEEEIVDALFNAAGIGLIIAENATLAGAEGGCQAEIGSAAAMAASAVTELRGGTPEQCLNAAALALKNMLGLTCDPLGGMVEVPCVKRTAFGAMHAITASDLTMCGVKSFIPFDEVVLAMKNIGKLMPTKLRETARGGLAVTKTGERIKRQLGHTSNGQ